MSASDSDAAIACIIALTAHAGLEVRKLQGDIVGVLAGEVRIRRCGAVAVRAVTGGAYLVGDLLRLREIGLGGPRLARASCAWPAAANEHRGGKDSADAKCESSGKAPWFGA